MINTFSFTLDAIKGRQWGRDIYTTNLPFGSVANLCDVDEEVQRKRDPKRIEEIADYILATMEGKKDFAGFNSICTSLRYGEAKFNDDTNQLTLTASSKLFIADGQHRLGGIVKAQEKILDNMEKAREEGDQELYNYWKKMNEIFNDEMSIPVVIFTDLMKEQEGQLFHDLNFLASPVAQTKALDLDRNDKFNKMSKELEKEIPQIKKYGIEKNLKQLSDKKTEVATLAIWNKTLRILFRGGNESELKKPWNDEWNYEENKSLAREFWTTLTEVLPEDFTDKEKYMITKSVYMQGLAAWGHNLIFEQKRSDWKQIVYNLKGFNWGYNNGIYNKFGGGSLSNKTNKKTGEIEKRFYFKGTRAAINSIPRALDDYINNPSSSIKYQNEEFVK